MPGPAKISHANIYYYYYTKKSNQITNRASSERQDIVALKAFSKRRAHPNKAKVSSNNSLFQPMGLTSDTFQHTQLHENVNRCQGLPLMSMNSAQPPSANKPCIVATQLIKKG